jgi:uncharacterized membrane protein YhaH (DUF805 family)
MNWFISCVTTNYLNFQGRARRKEYWMFTLFYFLIGLALGILLKILGMQDIAKLIQVILILALFLPSLAVTVRRLHDTNRSGWWCLVTIIPFLGSIILFIFMLLESTPGDNKYGVNPKE